MGEALLTNEASNTSRWRGAPISIADYDDLGQMVRLARKARSSIVEFEWCFSREDLLTYRRAIFESGSSTVGRYRAFDAKLLNVINQALGEEHTTLAIPLKKDLLVGDATCRPVDGGFQISGHTSFDIFFGHSSGAFTNDPWSTHLSSGARKTLASAVTPLGWDVKRLLSPNYLAVRRALYNIPMSYPAAAESVPASGPTLELDLRFEGPFTALDGGPHRCLFRDQAGLKSGIYLWTFGFGGSQFVWYVGQTRRAFAQRMAEHIAGYFSGEYPPVDPTALAEGRHSMPTGFGPLSEWPTNIPVLLERLPEIASNTLELMRRVQFHLAAVKLKPADLNRAEGAICRWCRAHTAPGIRSMIQPGMRVPARIPGDRPLRVRVSTESPIEGLPAEIIE